MGKYTRKVLTDIAWGPTRCGHHVSFAFHFGQSKVADHDFGLLILTVVQQVLRLERKVGEKKLQTTLIAGLIVGHDDIPDVASWVLPRCEAPRFPGPLLIKPDARTPLRTPPCE